jgi:cytochrome c553
MAAGWHKKALLLAVMALLAGVATTRLLANDEEVAIERHYAKAPDAPRGQTQEEADTKSNGCISCHSASDAPSMHDNQAVLLGCADCHGGDATVKAAANLAKTDPQYASARDRAHVLPRYPESWHYPSSANPKESYTCSIARRPNMCASSIRRITGWCANPAAPATWIRSRRRNAR